MSKATLDGNTMSLHTQYSYPYSSLIVRFLLELPIRCVVMVGVSLFECLSYSLFDHPIECVTRIIFCSRI